MDRKLLKEIAKLQYRENVSPITGVTLLYVLLTSIKYIMGFISLYYNSIFIIGIILGVIFTGLFTLGYYKLLLNLSKGNCKAEFNDLFSQFNMFLKTIGLGIVITLMKLLGFLLLIVPGIIVSYGVSQSHYILDEDNNKSIIDCIKESFRMTKGKKLDLFVLDLSFIGCFFHY